MKEHTRNIQYLLHFTVKLHSLVICISIHIAIDGAEISVPYSKISVPC